MSKLSIIAATLAVVLLAATLQVNAFTMPTGRSVSSPHLTRTAFACAAVRQQAILKLRMAGESVTEGDPMATAEEEMDEESKKAAAKARRADELRKQEVFMKKSTGKHQCTNCEWEYDEAKGDVMMIGGMIKPGTPFAELPSNWRCPVCRASKDNFRELVEEIPGFEVNQGYGFGTNSWTASQKNLAIFGGLGLFFVLFLSGYAMS